LILYKTSLELANAIAKAADDKKARDVVLMNMTGLSPATDYFVVCSANSTTQVKAISDNIEEQLHEAGHDMLHREGYREAEWVLLDYGDCVAHIFLQDSREYYSLESLWGDAELTVYEG
jgi:ribosome-associated protein